LFIVDNGVGIAADETERVFERMYRGRSADAGETDTRGLGLGLYISREIVHAHHGTIKLQSELQTGTMVCVTLPHQQPVRENA
jgi:signal transduction histidine kinase